MFSSLKTFRHRLFLTIFRRIFFLRRFARSVYSPSESSRLVLSTTRSRTSWNVARQVGQFHRLDDLLMVCLSAITWLTGTPGVMVPATVIDLM